MQSDSKSNLNALCYFSLPDNTSRQFGASNDGPEAILVLSVFCNLGDSSNDTPGSLTLVELKGYYETSEFSNNIPDLARAQSHATDNKDYCSHDAPLPVMMRGASAVESGQHVSRELVELSLQSVRQSRVSPSSSSQSYNFFIPLQDFYFDGSFEVHGTFLWTSANTDTDTADQTFHISLPLPNSCHKHFAQVAFGSIVTANTSAATIAQGLLACVHPLVSEMMQIRPLGRTYCCSDTFWVMRALFTYFQYPSGVFPSLLQTGALQALASHVSSVPEGISNHAPLLLAGIGVIVSLLPVEESVVGIMEGGNEDYLATLCSLAGSFFQPTHKELLKQLCDVNSDEGAGKKIFYDSDHFFEYFRSLRQALLFLLGVDTKGAATVSPSYPAYVALRHVLPLLQRPKMAASVLNVPDLYRSESEIIVKANIARLESFMREELWSKLQKARYVLPCSSQHYPTSVHLSSMREARDLVSLIGQIQFTPPDEDSMGHALGSEILKIQQYQEQKQGQMMLKDISPSLLDPSSFIRIVKIFAASFVSMTRHLADFASFHASYTQQCTEGATFSNFWSLEEYRAGLKCVAADQQSGLLLLWAGGYAGRQQSSAVKGSGVAPIPLDQFSMKQPWGVTCGNLQTLFHEQSGRPSLFVSGVNNTLHLLHSHDARTLLNNGPGALLGGLEVAQLRAAKSLCTYVVQLLDVAVTLLVIADTGNNSLRALVLSTCARQSMKNDDAVVKEFPEGKIFELAKINNPVAVCVFQDQLVVASHNDHVLYTVVYEKRKTLKQTNKV
jgi:hypothetical protein